MAHSHLGCQSPRDYFTEQLLTILVCGALGFVGIQMYLNDMLRHILAPQFHKPVLFGSIAVLVLVAVRAIAVWREAGSLQPVDDMTCQENHVHTAACNHLPGLPTGTAADENLMDDHGHSHDMSWVFARMLVLVFPVALFALGIPNSGFSAEREGKMLGSQTALNLDPKELEKLVKESNPKPLKFEDGSEERVVDGGKVRLWEVQTKEGGTFKVRETTASSGETRYVVVPDKGIGMSFNELNDAAFDPDKRASYTGQTAILVGKFRRLDDKEFTLYRLKMTCCSTDSVMLNVRIITPQVPSFREGQWVSVKGVIRFVKATDKKGQARYQPVLIVPDIKDIDPNVQVNNEYEI